VLKSVWVSVEGMDMTSRRQEKISRIVRDSVSDSIANHLSDPRIEEAFVSVTRVEVSADLRVANVYLSFFGGTEKSQKNAFDAIMHAKKRLQMLLAERIQSRFCPVLNIHRDEQFKKALETMKILEEIAKKSSQITGTEPAKSESQDEDTEQQ
jgi:ribosome-binding factor A